MEKKSNLQQPGEFGCKTRNPKYCKTCVFAHGEPPFEDSPEKAYCMIYTRESGTQKPDRVYYDGGVCEYFQDEKNPEGEDYE